MEISSALPSTVNLSVPVFTKLLLRLGLEVGMSKAWASGVGMYCACTQKAGLYLKKGSFLKCARSSSVRGDSAESWNSVLSFLRKAAAVCLQEEPWADAIS